MDCIRVVWLVQEPEVRDCDARFSVELDILRQQVGICLSPVPRRAGVSRRAAQIASVALVAVGLHEPRRAPRVRVDGLDAVAHGLLAEPDLAGVVIVPRVRGRVTRRPGAGGLDAVAGAAGPNAVPYDGQAGAGRRAEEVVEPLLLGRRCRVLELLGSAERLGHAEPVDLLELCPGVYCDGSLGCHQT